MRRSGIITQSQSKARGYYTGEFHGLRFSNLDSARQGLQNLSNPRGQPKTISQYVYIGATTRTATPTTRQTTTTTRTTTTTTAAPKQQTQPPKPVYTEADYAEIIAAVRAYSESKAFPFIWDTTLTYEYAQSGRAGYHDVVGLNQNGKDGVIKTLKYNADLTEWLASGGSGGVPSTEVHYNVVKVDYQGEPFFALIYG